MEASVWSVRCRSSFSPRRRRRHLHFWETSGDAPTSSCAALLLSAGFQTHYGDAHHADTRREKKKRTVTSPVKSAGACENRKKASADFNQPECWGDWCREEWMKEVTAGCKRTDLGSVRVAADAETQRLINHCNKMHWVRTIKGKDIKIWRYYNILLEFLKWAFRLQCAKRTWPCVCVCVS